MKTENLLKYVCKKRNDETFIDKLNNKFTAYFLFVFGFIVYSLEWFKTPIDCFPKSEWPPSWHTYANAYCYHGPLYFVGNASYPPLPELFSKNRKMVNYAYIPFYFFVMGLCLQTPRLFWNFINKVSTFKFELFMNAMVENYLINVKDQCKYVDGYLKHFKNCANQRRKNLISGKFLYRSFLCVKLLNIINNIIIFFMLTILVADQKVDLLGIKIIENLLNRLEWGETGMFPRVTVCTFLIRELGEGPLTTMSRKFVDCKLSNNLLVEMIFLILWFYFQALMIINICSLIYWLIFPLRSKFFISQLVNNATKGHKGSQYKRNLFLFNRSLNTDGRFILQIVKINAGDQTADELTKLLIKEFELNFTLV